MGLYAPPPKPWTFYLRRMDQSQTRSRSYGVDTSAGVIARLAKFSSEKIKPLDPASIILMDQTLKQLPELFDIAHQFESNMKTNLIISKIESFFSAAGGKGRGGSRTAPTCTPFKPANGMTLTAYWQLPWRLTSHHPKERIYVINWHCNHRLWRKRA